MANNAGGDDNMKGLTYKDAGVDIEEGNRAVQLMKDHVKSTHTPGVLTGLGDFAGLFEPDLSGYRRPVFVSGTDGVGTKLRVAFDLKRYDTVGIDLVAMSVNDILTTGARPLFFLDYIAGGKIEAEIVADLVKGVADGCRQAGCALLGGETAEMPGFYEAGDYDMAGFALGLVDRDRIIDGRAVGSGDALVAIASSGLHSNGYSLARRLLVPAGQVGPGGLGAAAADAAASADGSLAPAADLLEPTRIYVKSVLNTIEDLPEGAIHGMAHITGGGIPENLQRVIPDGLVARVDRSSWQVPAIFELCREKGGISWEEMFRTFNCGIGFVMVVDGGQASKAVSLLGELGETAWVLGEVQEADILGLDPSEGPPGPDPSSSVSGPASPKVIIE